MINLSQVIKKPLITEKTISNVKNNRFTFMVDKKADKNSVKKAVEEFFDVEVIKVWIMKYLGKKKNVGRKRKTIKKPDWKKAIVELKKGQKIDYFEIESN